ncbi:MAG: MFS transporter [Kiloniellales bacterium]
MIALRAAPHGRPELGPATELACYGVGFFSLGLVPMMSLAVPLWAVELEAAPFLIGIAVGARSVLPLLLSIHGGVVMDRLGVRRVMLWLAAGCVLLVPLYPALPWLPALVLLQLLFGLAQGLAWVGAQTQIGQLTRGHPRHAGRFSFSSTAGTFVGPLAVGIAWDVGGGPGAFLTIGLWAAALWLAILFLPRGEETAATARSADWRALVPRLADYRAALALAAVPAVAFVVIATFARIGTLSIQGSFYTVYLESIAFSGTEIGALIALAAIVAALAALLNGAMARVLSQGWTLVGGLVVSTLAVAATPFFAGLSSLAALAVLFGIGIGLTFPPILTILSHASGEARQGLSVGLRTTANRFASLVVPVTMGAAADLFGLAGAFVVLGLALGVVLLIMAAMTRRFAL